MTWRLASYATFEVPSSYSGEVSRRFAVGNGERVVVSVTPSAWGVRVPAVAVLVAVTTVVGAGLKISLVHHYESEVLVALVGPPTLWWATRIARWRSHKIYVTSEQVVVEGGVLHRESFRVPIDSLVTVEVRQRLHQRVRRQGIIELVTTHDTVTLGPVHHPDALARVIEQQRRSQRPFRTSYGAIFEPTIPETTWDGNPFAPR